MNKRLMLCALHALLRAQLRQSSFLSDGEVKELSDCEKDLRDHLYDRLPKAYIEDRQSQITLAIVDRLREQHAAYVRRHFRMTVEGYAVAIESGFADQWPSPAKQRGENLTEADQRDMQADRGHGAKPE